MLLARRLPRWGLVLTAVLVLVLLPTILGRLPARSSSISAADLLARIQGSSGQAYSGYAESNGGLALPVTTGQFSSLADLFGQRTQLRVWWRGSEDHRVDAVTLSGETDTIRFPTRPYAPGSLGGVVIEVGGTPFVPGGVWTWQYEADRATLVQGASDTLRLPSSSDLLPPELGRRLLSQATAVTRIGTQRVAGHDTAGLRLRPTEPGSTITRVDVWADVTTGLPLKVEAYGASGGPVLSSTFLDVSMQTPSATLTAFTPPGGAKIQTDDPLDLVGAVNRFGGDRPPATLGGLTRNDGVAQVGAVGVYGRGITELTATPLPGRTAGSLRGQLMNAAGITDDNGELSIAVGPLSLLLTRAGPRGSAWLLVGTLDITTLRTAAADLPPAEGFR